MKVIVDYDELYNLKNQLSIYTNNLSMEMNHIEALLLSLPDGWQGNTEQKLANKLILIKKEYENLITFLNESCTRLDSAAFDFEKFDAEMQSKLNSI